jgi:Universal stress protein family
VSQLTLGRSLRERRWTDGPAAEGRARLPVVLGTLASRVTPAAERMAFDSALESGSPLIVANMLRLPPYPTTIMLLGAGAATLPHEEDLDAVRATANRAAALGLKTELLRISSPRPVKALLELLAERRAGLLVFGPDPQRVGARKLRSAARTLARDAPCLVWIPALDGERL